MGLWFENIEKIKRLHSVVEIIKNVDIEITSGTVF